jgi:hypothetical protein
MLCPELIRWRVAGKEVYAGVKLQQQSVIAVKTSQDAIPSR